MDTVRPDNQLLIAIIILYRPFCDTDYVESPYMMLFFLGHACPKQLPSLISARTMTVFSSSPVSMMASIPRSFNKCREMS
jgi:hypothetical protein